jgi:hypothetical protein
MKFCDKCQETYTVDDPCTHRVLDALDRHVFDSTDPDPDHAR